MSVTGLLTVLSSDVENPSSSSEVPMAVVTPYKSADTFKGLCPDEVADFVQLFGSYQAIETYLLSTFFTDDWCKEEKQLYTNTCRKNNFVCNVFTFGDSPFVIKQLIDLTQNCENGRLRWFPELINHKLAESLLPDHTLRMHAACVNRTFTHFYFVYDRADTIEVYNFDDMFEVVQKLNGLGMFHLDTKPSNFLTLNGKIMIHDFGIALPVEMHACPGSLMFSDPIVSDRELWDAVTSFSFGSSPFDTIRDFSLQCQVRLLYARVSGKFASRFELPAHTIGLGVEGMYTSPPWFEQMFTILTSFSTYSVLRAWTDFRVKLLSKA